MAIKMAKKGLRSTYVRPGMIRTTYFPKKRLRLKQPEKSPRKRSKVYSGGRFGPESSRQTLESPIFRFSERYHLCRRMFPKMYCMGDKSAILDLNHPNQNLNIGGSGFQASLFRECYKVGPSSKWGYSS